MKAGCRACDDEVVQDPHLRSRWLLPVRRIN
jgi:hypothetical protein